MPRAFTLIELLVVVTIIVVLLALLAPSLDKAIYQAELAVCAARLHAIAGSTLGYAFDNTRHYPYRPGVADPNAIWQPHVLYSGDQPHSALSGRALKLQDERIVFRTYMPLNTFLNDPLMTKLDFENADIDTTVWASYFLWFSWQYYGANGGAGMMKVGDSFNWTDVLSDLTRAQPGRYALLASDRDVVNPAASQAGHPDHGEQAHLVSLQNGTWSVQGPVGYKFTIDSWITSGAFRTNVDLSYAFDDASVTRYNEVEPFDDRMGYVPSLQDGSGYGPAAARISLPRAAR